MTTCPPTPSPTSAASPRRPPRRGQARAGAAQDHRGSAHRLLQGRRAAGAAVGVRQQEDRQGAARRGRRDRDPVRPLRGRPAPSQQHTTTRPRALRRSRRRGVFAFRRSLTRRRRYALVPSSDDVVSAFGDDALGDLDAVGVVEAIAAGAVSVAELVEAAIARTEKVNPQLNGLAYEAFDRARARACARTPYGGFFDGVPTFVKDNVAVEGMPTMEGTDAWEPRPAARQRRLRPRLPVDRAGRRSARPSCRSSASAPSAEHPRLGPGAQSVEHRLHRRRVVVGVGRLRGRRRGADRARQRRRRVDPDPRVVQRTGRPQAVAAAGCRWTRTCAQMPIRIVANGVVTRSVRDTAAFYREVEKVWRNPKLPPIGDVTGPGRQRLRVAVFTKSVKRECSPEVRELHPARPPRCWSGLGHRVEHLDDHPVPESFIDDFLLYWALLAFALVRGGRRTFGPSVRPRPAGQPHPRARRSSRRRNLHRLPLAIARLATLRRRITARLRRLRRAADADAGRRAAPRSGTSTRRPTTSRSSSDWSTGWRSRRCRTSPVTRRSRCRWPNRPTGCRSA